MIDVNEVEGRRSDDASRPTGLSRELSEFVLIELFVNISVFAQPDRDVDKLISFRLHLSETRILYCQNLAN